MWRKRVYSGVCQCGHSWDDHHGMLVLNPKYIEQTGEDRVAGECEFYGFNETGGMMPDGMGGWKLHCGGYIDKDAPKTE